MRRDQRGAVLPSPVVVLSIVAVVMAAVVFVATRGGGEAEREITPAARSEASPTASADPSGSATPSAEAGDPTATPTSKPEPPPLQRAKVYVEVYNNSSITGLASRVAATAGDAGWNVVGADNWYGTIPATTVYFPPRLQRAARALATDLGIRRTAPAVEPMRMDRLTLILTGELR